MLTLEHILDTLAAAGCDSGAAYVSMPITSGLREVRFALRKKCQPAEARHRFTDEWQEQVQRPNEDEGRTAVAKARSLLPGKVVVDPSRLSVDGWDQADYMSLWSVDFPQPLGPIKATHSPESIRRSTPRNTGFGP